MSETLKLTIEKGEFWYGGFIDDTGRMPYSERSEVHFDAIENHAYNEVNPLLISSTGRYVYAERYFVMDISGGVISLESPGKIDFGKKENFRAAYAYLRDTYFPFDGRHPDEFLFRRPQYCTWMALGENQTREGVLTFAQSVLDAGMPAGELIIDDGWTDYVGQFDFAKSRFDDPKAMCARLRALGFRVAVWMTPYVSPDSPNFRALLKKDFLVKKAGECYLTHWWDGYSACIDFTNPGAREWVRGKIASLMTRYGIEGVKMDGGDPRLYENGLETYGEEGRTANGLAEAYGRFAAEFSLVEIRSTAKCGGLPVMQRIADRYHAWEDEKNGFDGIVKKSLVMSFTGYPYNCPDMIGGGQIGDIEEGVAEDEELNIRYMEAAVLLPSFQFSKVLWSEEGETKRVVLKMLAVRKKYSDYIADCVKHCAATGEPIIRTMLYQYNILPAETGQFLLGEEILVAPVVAKGAREKDVYLPEGKWRYEPTGEEYAGNRKITVPAPLDELPYFVQIKE